MRPREHIRNPCFWLMMILSLIATTISLTGRYDILPHQDLTWDLMNAHNLITKGELPQHGGASSLYSLVPPGVDYGFVPGLLVFPHHPVRAERLGASLLFFLTLLGLYLWLNPRLGFWPTALAMLLYSAGSIGAFYMTSLWPRAHPVFLVWFLYALSLWVERRKGTFLGIALCIFAAGTYWYLEFAPALFIIPVLYFLYRPPIGRWSIPAALLFGILLWSPYLNYEAGRGYADLKSLLTRKPACALTVADVVYDKGNHLVNAWDVPKLKAAHAAGIEPAPEAAESWQNTKDWGTVWVQHTPRIYLGECGLVFHSDKEGGWCFQSMETGRLIKPAANEWAEGAYSFTFQTPYRVTLRQSDNLTQKKLKNFGPLYNFGWTQSFWQWLWQVLLALCLTVYAVAKSRLPRTIADAFRSWKNSALRKPERTTPVATKSAETTLGILLLGTVIPLVAMTCMIPWVDMCYSERRFYWLWVVEAALMGATLGMFILRNTRIGATISLLAVASFALNTRSIELARDVFKGWPTEWQGPSERVINELTDMVEAEGKTSAHIGYDLNVSEWRPECRKLDGASKCGREWDVALLLSRGITNLNVSAEGIRADDEFRIVEKNLDVNPTARFHNRWSMTEDGSLPQMDMAKDLGDYAIMRSKPVH